ncbi:Oidioi.mRNA.OKI2018_I69.XSR.g13896.t1.cds [Oikopleura dioica]|uniref:Oidioi.mRNA.OKI2018_I69.XSR.g13896.t1.cds n=1 Tax=Oikopleura dioica TaxID=34765 RepID=A0ABN7S8B2_OIKDI|nr:Oidioi.mRNA.OKI2018_I69.XSR.g13896.t1.cds [Oikopleura dioica]
MISACSNFVRRIYFIYEMNTGIYLLKFHEKAIYHLITGLITLLICYSTYTYLPSYMRKMGRILFGNIEDEL